MSRYLAAALATKEYQPIRLKIKQLTVRILLSIVGFGKRIFGSDRKQPGLLSRFGGLVWRRIARPFILVFYKLVVVIRQRSKNFFHAQHRLLAIMTHRITLHVFIVVLASSVLIINVSSAQTVRAENFVAGSLVSNIVTEEIETVVTADFDNIGVSESYIDTSLALRYSDDTTANAVVTSGDGLTAGNAIVKQNIIGGDPGSTTEIQTYVVQGGDTASSIAAKFGVSTQTVLWSNDLSDASLIKPGQTLYILPTSGVAYTVESGDTLASIADEFSASEEEILDFNNFIDADDLVAGAEIIVPGGEKPAPPAPAPVTNTATQLASVREVFSSAPQPSAPVSSGTSFQWPTSCTRISQYFRYGHSGLDIDCEFGNPIYAAESGTVTLAGWNGAYGIQVQISHGNGIVTTYAHLQNLYVQAGQTVSRGQSLGEMGSTGRSTGSHLHYEVRVNGGAVNPYIYH